MNSWRNAFSANFMRNVNLNLMTLIFTVPPFLRVGGKFLLQVWEDLYHFRDDERPHGRDVLGRHPDQDHPETEEDRGLDTGAARDGAETFRQPLWKHTHNKKEIKKRNFDAPKSHIQYWFHDAVLGLVLLFFNQFFELDFFYLCLPWMSGICFWYWSTSEQKMTNAKRFKRRARCSSSCSLLENRLSEPDWEMEDTLAGEETQKWKWNEMRRD